jgi:DDE superfamily endonuclease
MGENGKSVLRLSTESLLSDCLNRTLKFPESVMIWGCMTSKGLGSLHFIEGTMNSTKYTEILRESLIPSITQYFDNGDFIFQQDGASCHTSKFTKTWMMKNNMSFWTWPSGSPDLSPIENVWAIMKKELRKKRPKNKIDLKNKILAIWNSFPIDKCQDLYNSMNRRMEDVIKAKGDVTRF